LINGKVYDWESITIGLPHGILIGIENIDYEDELESELAYGKGSKALGYGNGNYKASTKITIMREELEKLMGYAKSIGKPLYRIPPFPVTVSYANDGQRTKTDIIKGCKLTKTAHKAAQNAKKLTVDLDLLVVDQIVRDGLAAV
jgi:hypothetical protein